MDENLNTGCLHAGPCSEADARVDITDLSNGGIGQQTLNVLFLQRIEGAENHGTDAKEKQNICNT